ncbi:MAG: hypothetical protein EU541_02095 [Promethearchaeota archaeon]|nr:MAG: hypothetical protein EU541_02095 [Candidatus Lokiarchaeota archaeon]
MTIYEFTVISVHGYPYYNKIINPIPSGIKVFLRFFDFSQKDDNITQEREGFKFDLKAGLISALYNFSSQINQKIDVLEFHSKTINDQNERKENNYQGNVLMSVTTEPFLFHSQVQKKMALIYDSFIASKIPLDEGNQLLYREQTEIIDILTDVKAKNHLSKNNDKIQFIATHHLDDMKNYGLKAIVLTSFDLTPLLCFANDNIFCLEDIIQILRNVGNIPDIEPFDWKYRQSFYNDNSMWVYLINSGVGIKVMNLFENYYYLLITDPNAYLGEFPAKLTSEFNNILS